MDFAHVPVMLRECLEGLQIDPDGVYADGTPFAAPHGKYDPSEKQRHGGIKEARYEPDDKGRVSIRKLYLDPFMDMWNLEILSYGISDRPSADSIMGALNAAIGATNDCRYRRTFHSDRGWAYQMNAYRYELKKHKIFQSMSRKGNCYDNSPMENFFGIMKQEMYYGQVYNSFKELKDAIDRYICYYNEKRGKASLGYRSPIEYRKEMFSA